MGLFNFFGKSNNNNNNSKPQTASFTHGENKSEENKIQLKETLTKSLSSHNFNEKEIAEVFLIIDMSYADINRLKMKLLNVKNTANPVVEIINIKKEIELIQQQMAANIKMKIKQIKIRKNKAKKAKI